MKFLTFKLEKYYSNVNFACSTEAGEYLFGKNIKFEIIPNAIDIEKFKYNKQLRDKVRKELQIENNFVIGHIGSESFQCDFFGKIIKIRHILIEFGAQRNCPWTSI